jgi:hypothetical protein
MRIMETKVYKFSELSPEAKEKARDWYRETAFDYDWWDAVYEQVVASGEALGIRFKQRHVPLMNGRSRTEPCIWFSGFASQGDGACFEGTYAYLAGWRKKLEEYWGKTTIPADLLEIGESLQAVQKAARWSLTASVAHVGRYYHENSVSIHVTSELEVKDFGDKVTLLEEALRDFCRWIYKRLEREYDWLNADEQVDESMEANEYEFTENGRIA